MSRISATGLGKAYRYYDHPRDRFLEFLPGFRKKRHSLQWAVRDVTFTVEDGEAVGIIGLNGAGKSTLLRLLTGTTAPTAGEFTVEGQVAALLELGIGIHPEFTGRQNARLSLQLLGLTESRINEVLPWIQEFSDLGHHMDQPVRTYSTGMQVRLAFSAATAVRPDVLIIDEALSVGDIIFQHRSMGRIKEMRSAGTTVLFVTHDPGAVKALCDRALLLDQGRIVCEGKPPEVYDFYNARIALQQGAPAAVAQQTLPDGEVSTRSGGGEISIRNVELEDSHGAPARVFPVAGRCRVMVAVNLDDSARIPTVGFLIRDRLGNDVFGSNTWHLELPEPQAGDGLVRVAFETELRLGPGHYSMSISLHQGATHLEENHDWWERAVVFQVVHDESPIFSGVAQLHVKAAWVES